VAVNNDAWRGGLTLIGASNPGGIIWRSVASQWRHPANYADSWSDTPWFFFYFGCQKNGVKSGKSRITEVILYR